MTVQLLALGVVGIRLYDRLLTATARYPDQLADQLVEEIYACLLIASPAEKEILFLLAREVHELFGRQFYLVNDLATRRKAVELLDALIVQAKHRAH